MRLMSPMTFIVVAALATFLFVGLILLLRSRSRRRGAVTGCNRCGHNNPGPAKFCALCGAPIPRA
jgi:hypothetical protein